MEERKREFSANRSESFHKHFLAATKETGETELIVLARCNPVLFVDWEPCATAVRYTIFIISSALVAQTSRVSLMKRARARSRRGEKKKNAH